MMILEVDAKEDEQGNFNTPSYLVGYFLSCWLEPG